MQNEEITSNVSLDELFSNPDLHSLDINSDEFAAAVTKTKNEQVDEDSAPVTDEDDTEKQEVEEDEPKKKSGFSKRIDKLTAEKRALERRLAELEAPEPAPINQPDNSRPKSADYDSHEDYIEALTDWKLDQRDLEREEVRKRTEITTSWEAKEAQAKTAYADYEEIVNVDSFNASNASREAKVFLADSNLGPDVIYNLVSNEDLFDEFAEANPVNQIKILTKIELALESKQTPSSTKVTSAPNPPKKLNASRLANTGRDLIQHAGEMSDAEWLRLADEHSRKRKRQS